MLCAESGLDSEGQKKGGRFTEECRLVDIALAGRLMLFSSRSRDTRGTAETGTGMGMGMGLDREETKKGPAENAIEFQCS